MRNILITGCAGFIGFHSVKKCIDVLMRDDEMDYSDAMQYFTFNVSGAYIENGPVWCWDDFE